MVFKKGFDSEKYIREQSKYILQRVSKFDKKLYLEFGGKIIADYHAARVLPGYEPNNKIKILQKLGKNVEIVICISAKDIQDKKKVESLGITYDNFVLKMIDDLRGYKLFVSTIVITFFTGQSSAEQFKNYLKKKGLNVYTTGYIEGYPHNIENIASKEGYGKKPFIKTTKPIVVVTGAGPNSGKMSTCLTMVYQDKQKGLDSGYAKFETFPIWNIPLEHPINIAYEAATAEIKDFNLIDPHHYKAYHKIAINYNRDVENFVVIQNILKSIISKDNFMRTYRSPTDMGVNMAKVGITNDKVCREAANQEIIRRYYLFNYKYLIGQEKQETIEIMENLLKKAHLKKTDRPVVVLARKAAEVAEKSGKKGYQGIYCGAAIELANGNIVVGKNSSLLHAESAVILNAIKELSKIPDPINLISEKVICGIKNFKVKAYGENAETLDVEETLIALAVSSISDPKARLALEQLPLLKNAEMHTTIAPSKSNEFLIRKLGINLTTDGKVSGNKLYLEEN